MTRSRPSHARRSTGSRQQAVATNTSQSLMILKRLPRSAHAHFCARYTVVHTPRQVSRCAEARACYTWKASTLHPWKLTAHIMNENLRAGVELHTHTYVRAVVASQTPGHWLVKTDRGAIETPRVVHATNAYCAAIEPSLRGIVRPTPHVCTQIVPPPCLSGSKALSSSYGILASNGALFSINPRQGGDGSILFGGSNPANKELEDLIERHPERCIDDSLTGMNKIIGAVQDFAHANFEGWQDATSAPGQGLVHQWCVWLYSRRCNTF